MTNSKNLTTGTARLALATAMVAGASTGAFAQEGSCPADLGQHEPLLMVTGTPTGTWFPTGTAIAELTNANYQGEPVGVQVGSGAIGNVMSVGTGRSELGLSYGPFLLMAQRGNNEINPGEPMEDLRAVLSLATNAFHVMRTNDAPFETFDELVEKEPRVFFGTGVPGASEHFAMSILLDHYGTSFEEIDDWGGAMIFGSMGERFEDWSNGKLDLYGTMSEPPYSQITRMFETTPSTLMSLDDEVIDYFTNEYGYGTYTIPANSYPGQTEDVQTVGVPYALFTRADIDEDIIYQMVKCVAENPERLAAAAYSYEEGWAPEDMPENLGIELHEGAARYYRERGWIE